jgi:hypothetical protein
MLLLTHTWVLKEFLGDNWQRHEYLDLFTYNASPDLLPIHTALTPEITHGVPRSGPIPAGFAKAAFARFHLLVDDVAHHGAIRRAPVRTFNRNSPGYAYVKGRPLIEHLAALQRRAGVEANPDRLAYQAHMIIEMAFDLTLYRELNGTDLIGLFCEALHRTVTDHLDEFSTSLGWLFAVDTATIDEAIGSGKDACTQERMTHFMDGPERVGLFLDKFGLDRGDERIWQDVEDLIAQGAALIGDCREFLALTLAAIRDFGFPPPPRGDERGHRQTGRGGAPETTSP